MAANTNEYFIDVIGRYLVYKTIWNVFVEEVLVHEQETKIKATMFIFEGDIYNHYCNTS